MRKDDSGHVLVAHFKVCAIVKEALCNNSTSLDCNRCQIDLISDVANGEDIRDASRLELIDFDRAIFDNDRSLVET